MTVRLAPLALLPLLFFANHAPAQTPPPARSAQAAAPVVSVSATPSGLRFAALGSVKQTRLEVYDSAGAPVLDTGFLAGNVRDWQPQASGLADGTYQCVLSARDLSGRLSVKQAAVLIAGGQASLSLGEAEGAGGVASSARADEQGAATLATHDGSVGAVTSTAGDLTLRTGDLLTGKDEERVRVTADGKVGIGTAKPEAALDVAGEVRATAGFRFSDGSKLTVNEQGALTRTSADGQPLPALGASVAAATAGRLPKFTDAAGMLADSSVFESGGFVGIGTTAPEGIFHIQSPDTTVFKVVSTGAPNTGRAVFQMYRGTAAQATGWDFGYNTDLATEGFIIRELTSGSSQPRVSIQKGTGNFGIGIGTSAPQAKLDVGGTVRFTGLRTEATSVNPTPVPGPPNVIGGFLGTGGGGATPGNRVMAGVVGATIGGGGFNGLLTLPSGLVLFDGNRTSIVTDWFGTVGGGLNNRAGNGDSTLDNASYATVGGGLSNIATGIGATVGGGEGNAANNDYATVGGGERNTASDFNATVGGGGGNTASFISATVGGGSGNTAAGVSATVGGGEGNAAGGDYATVPGGRFNAASHYSFAAGRRAKALNIGAFVWADATNADFSSTADNQFLVRAAGGVGINTNAPRGALHVRKDETKQVVTLLTLMNGGGFVDAGAAIDFSTFDTGTNPPSARIIATDANNFAAHLGFWTRATGGDITTAPSERVRISPDGNVGIGTSSPQARLHVQGGDVYVGGAGQGVILKSPSGTVCRRLGIDNAGAVSLTPIACP